METGRKFTASDHSPHSAGKVSSLSNSPFSVAIVLLAGLSVRVYEASAYFLDPDEALHTLLARYDSATLTYKATLTTAHPPLLIIFLHYWQWLGRSEFVLRLPSLVAGTLSCWLLYLWMRKIADESTAFVVLLLCSFAPALIELSTQVRQYAILNLFLATALYCSERALQGKSTLWMNLFSLSLCGAVLTHYSAFLFVFSMGVYLLVRLRPWRNRNKLFGVWAAGQVLVAALCAFFLLVHIPQLKQVGMPQEIANTWLRRSIYHPGESSALIFPARQTLRVFTYLFSQGLLGTVALLFFLSGFILLIRGKSAERERPSSRELAVLIATPFAVNCILAIAGIYPYGGTRHDVYLAPFAFAGISFGFPWKPKHVEWKVAVTVACLALCNVFPAPPPLIRAKDHRAGLMQQAFASLKTQAPPGSTLFVDYQSGLELGYYLCDRNVLQVFYPLEPFSRMTCGPYTVVAPSSQQWQFEPGNMTPALHNAVQRYQLPPKSVLWLFEAGAGWMPADKRKVEAELSSLGCKAQHFGENIRICPITIGDDSAR